MYSAIREAECNSQVTKHLHFGLPFFQSQRDAHRLINEHGLSGRCTVLDGRREEGREGESASELVSHSSRGVITAPAQVARQGGRGGGQCSPSRRRHCNYLGNIILKSGCCPRRCCYIKQRFGKRDLLRQQRRGWWQLRRPVDKLVARMLFILMGKCKQ